jgi:phosphate transport system substrate-binding protein
LVSALVADYRARNPRDSIAMGAGLGSSARLQAVADGQIDIAMASHGVVADDLRRRGLEAHEIARTAVVFAVQSSVPVPGLTRQQVCDIFTGTVTNWRDLGGPDLPVVPRMRPAAEVDAEVVVAGIACLRGLRYGLMVQMIERPDDMASALSATPGAIGVTSQTYVELSGASIRSLALDGVSPQAGNVASGEYSLTRRAILVTKAPSAGAVARFLAYTRSADGERVIRASGAVPVR